MSVDEIADEIAKVILTHGPNSDETRNRLQLLVDVYGPDAVAAARLVLARTGNA